MRMLLIGAPGAGKGTQAQLIAERFSIAHISSGDLLRHHVTEGTSIGRAVLNWCFFAATDEVNASATRQK